MLCRGLACRSVRTACNPPHLGPSAELAWCLPPLLPLFTTKQPVQIVESHLVAGTASQLLYARIEAPRFAKIYSAKGRWALLDHMLLTSAPIAASSAAAAAAPVPSSGAPAARAPSAAAGSCQQRSSGGVELGQVVQAVKRAAADILGEELDGERTEHG